MIKPEFVNMPTRPKNPVLILSCNQKITDVVENISGVRAWNRAMDHFNDPPADPEFGIAAIMYLLDDPLGIRVRLRAHDSEHGVAGEMYETFGEMIAACIVGIHAVEVDPGARPGIYRYAVVLDHATSPFASIRYVTGERRILYSGAYAYKEMLKIPTEEGTPVQIAKRLKFAAVDQWEPFGLPDDAIRALPVGESPYFSKPVISVFEAINFEMQGVREYEEINRKRKESLEDE